MLTYDSLAHKQLDTTETAPLAVLSATKPHDTVEIGNAPILSEDVKTHLKEVLAIYSDDDFDASQWSIHIASAKRDVHLVFPSGGPQINDQILRVTILRSIVNHSSGAVARRLLHDSRIFFDYLKDKHIPIASCKTSTFNRFKDSLETDNSLSIGQKNNILYSAAMLISTCAEYGLLYAKGKVVCNARFRGGKKEPKRAPDHCIIGRARIMV